MALLAPCPELVPESWLAPSNLTHPDDLWMKFEFENERTLVLPNPSLTSDCQLASFLDMGGGGVGGGVGVGMLPTSLPTPPHSPPTEHDLDDLVASIPEILESPSTSPPSAISEILSDLEGMETSSSPSRLEGGWCPEWWGGGLVNPHIEASIKKDIMWGWGGSGGTGTSTTTTTTTTDNTTTVTTPTTTGTITTTTTTVKPVEVKKERQDSESSTEVVYRGDITYTDFSDDSDSDDLPDTPSCTDSDADNDDHLWQSPHHHHHQGNSNSHPSTPSVDIEHNYCGRVPDHHYLHHHTTGTITPSDTEDEVDVVSCSDQNDLTTTPTPTPTTATARLHLPPPPTTTPTTSTPTTKGSVDVKRQLQLAIQEAVRNRQNRSGNSNNSSSSNTSTTATATATTTATTTTTPGEGGDVSAAGRLLSVKIKTQGKPAAYTKRMRDYHSEVVKSTKHRRRNKGENDEGRRSVHNSLERQRRVDLRNAFEFLRQLVPDTKILEKAPKVQILKKAALHCKQLQHAEQRLLREKEKLRKQLEELQQRKSLSS